MKKNVLTGIVATFAWAVILWFFDWNKVFSGSLGSGDPIGHIDWMQAWFHKGKFLVGVAVIWSVVYLRANKEL